MPLPIVTCVDFEWLRSRLREPLIESSVRPDGMPSGDSGLGAPPEEGLTPAAVLVPLLQHPDGVTVLFTRRTEHLHDHAGQISFPGGRVDPEDDSPFTTALRETEEEIGLARTQIEILGCLPQYRTGTGFLITPVVGLLSPPLSLAPDEFEVAEVFEVPLSFLMNPANHQKKSMLRDGRLRQYYAMPYKDYYIWGATAGILVNLYSVLKEPLKSL